MFPPPWSFRRIDRCEGNAGGFFRDEEIARRSHAFCWRSARILISSEARDRNNPTSANQISLQSSIIEQKLHPIRGCSPVVLGLR